MDNLKRYALWALAGIGTLAIVVLILIVGRNAVYNLGYTTDSYYSAPVTALSDFAVAESMMAFEEAGDYGGELVSRTSSSVTMGDGTVVDPKIIKTGTLELVVDDVDVAAEQVENVASTNEGYVERTEVYERTDGTRYASITLRIPVENFSSALEGIKGYALVVEREQVSADDVTEDYVDILARLNNAKAQETRYLAILEQAETVEDILNVERELTYTRELIERYQGQINYLDSQTSLSTITVVLEEEPVVEIAGKEFRPGTTVKLAAATLVAFGQWLVNAIIWLVIFGGGVGIPVALIIWGGMKWQRSRK